MFSCQAAVSFSPDVFIFLQIYWGKMYKTVYFLVFHKAAEEIEDPGETRSASGNIPPPPPPFPGGIPPPPPLAMDGVPGGRSVAVQSRVKLRPFFWNKVPAQMVSENLYLYCIWSVCIVFNKSPACFSKLTKIPCHLHDDVIFQLLIPKSFSFFLPYSNLDITCKVKLKSLNLHKKAKPWSILAVILLMAYIFLYLRTIPAKRLLRKFVFS